jgi:hypothetical protein
MIVPGRTGSEWRAFVILRTFSPQDLKKAQADAERFGGAVSEFLPLPLTQGTNYDRWHR